MELMVDGIFAITLIESIDRRKQILEVLPNANIEFYFVKRHSNPFQGNYESHQNVIKLAKSRGYRNVLIFEDDVYPLENWEKIVTNINDFIKHPPKNWEILSLGYIPFRLLETNNPKILKVNCAYDAHSYIVNLENFELKSWNGIDLDATMFCNGRHYNELITNPKNLIQGDSKDNVYALYPQLFKQKSNKSALDDTSLLQNYVFMSMGGFNMTAIIAKYMNTIYFTTLIWTLLLLFIVLCISIYLKNYNSIKATTIIIIFIIIIFLNIFYLEYQETKQIILENE